MANTLPEGPQVAGAHFPLTSDQICKALDKMKNGKAAGLSGIITQMMKATGKECIRLLSSLVIKYSALGSSPEIGKRVLYSIFTKVRVKLTTVVPARGSNSLIKS